MIRALEDQYEWREVNYTKNPWNDFEQLELVA